jgi:Predicted membrane protein (DUF2306)
LAIGDQQSTLRSIIQLASARDKLTWCLWLALAIWGIKIWLSILYQYRWYFPPDFDEGVFLIGRRATFHGLYRIAFYTHIIASPIAIVLAALLFFSARTVMIARDSQLASSLIKVFSRSGRAAYPWSWHRRLGKLQILIVVLFVAPSGIIMAWGTFFGVAAALGFTAQSLATLAAALASIHFARARDIPRHQVWATMTWLLLLGPLVFRVIAGLTIVTNWESILIYQVNSWTSWLILPLVWYFFKRR